MTTPIDPDHPSEALLPTFGHDALDVVLVPNIQAGQARGGAVIAALLAALGVGIAVAIASDGDFAAAVAMGSLMTGTGAIVGMGMALTQRRLLLSLTARTLRIRTVLGGRTLRTRELELRNVRTAHAVDAAMVQGQAGRRGLRIAMRDGEELFLPAPAVPPASLEWYAHELRSVAARVGAEPVGEVAPELEQLLSDDSRRRLEAARRAHAARQRA